MSEVAALDAGWARSHPLPEPGDGGKDERGKVLIVGGGLDLAGALQLCGVAALRAGAGKLQIATARDAAVALSIAVPEARVIGLPQTASGRLAKTGAAVLADPVGRCDGLLVGPGMTGATGFAAALLRSAGDRPTVVDAGALPALAPSPSGPRILTPHAGEMAGLLGRDIEAIEADPLAAAREAAGRFNAVVVMKGASTHVVEPNGAALLYGGGGPGLGVSGSGDVLAGIIVGLLARGVDAFDAAASGVFLHGEAGRRLADRVGRLGFLAREIAGEIPALLGAFGPAGA